MTVVFGAAFAPPAVASEALGVACRQGRLLGLDRVVVISIAPFDVALPPAVIASAVRDGGPPESVASDLADAFGDDLAGLLVAYVGCLTGGAEPALLADEIVEVARSVGGVMVIEPESGEDGTKTVEDLAARLGDSRAGRWVSPSGLGFRSVVLAGRSKVGSGPPLRVVITDHQGKSAEIASALRQSGHLLVEDAADADALLIDHDAPFHGRLPLVEACVAAGGRAFLYPHGADPANKTSWDGQYPISPLLSGSLVLAPGHAEIARRYGYPYPVEVVGWPFCELASRKRGRPVRRVLFAPTHPPYLGNPRYPGRNTEMFRRLVDAPVEVTVRHVGSIEENGLWEAPGVTFVRGDMGDAPGQITQIDAADAVVADRSTFGNLAVARGVTAVLWDSTEVYNNDASRQPDHLDRYRDLLRYPFDADDGDMWDLLRAASEDEHRVAVWRERFVGSPLDTESLVSALRGA